MKVFLIFNIIPSALEIIIVLLVVVIGLYIGYVPYSQHSVGPAIPPVKLPKAGEATAQKILADLFKVYKPVSQYSPDNPDMESLRQFILAVSKNPNAKPSGAAMKYPILEATILLDSNLKEYVSKLTSSQLYVFWANAFKEASQS